MTSITIRSFNDCSITCALMIASPPVVRVTPSMCGSIFSISVACFSTTVSLPVKPATIKPVFPSLLIMACAACGDVVHGDCTSAT
jgi:hypothetical protein